MKLFMRSAFDKKEYEFDTELKYANICMTCAGKMGGKPSDWARGSWKYDHCDVCDNKTEVTHHSEYIWRS